MKWLNMELLMVTCTLLTLLGAHGQSTSTPTSTSMESLPAPASKPLSDTLEEVSSTDPREEMCEANCVVVALSGEPENEIPEFCEEECPEYILPEEALSPEAACATCPHEECSLCICSTGECIQHLRVFVPILNSFTCSNCTPRSSCRNFWWC